MTPRSTTAATAALAQQVRRSVWWGWGDPALAHPLPAAAWRALAAELGVDPDAAVREPVEVGEVRLPPVRLAADELTALADLVGAEHVSAHRLDRVEHAAGKSYPDLRRLRDGDGSGAPDAVVWPGSADEVASVLRLCADRGVAVVPFGGGTSVVGGVTAGRDGEHRPVVTLDLRRLDRVLSVDEVSLTATVQAGARGPQVESALHRHGLTLGHYPQSHQQATVGGYVATRSAGQASTGYGRVDDKVLAVRVETPSGALRLGGRAPASAAGPRLLDLVVGSEGALGAITEATLAVHRLPAHRAHAAVGFASWDDGVAALRALAQDHGTGALPEVCRLSDPEETRVALTLAGASGERLSRWLAARGAPRPCLVVLVWEGASARVLRRRRRAALAVLGRHGSRRLPAAVARSWQAGRFEGPYLRDELLGRGVLVETLETATSWADLPELHRAVGTALRESFSRDGLPAVVQCHVSHVYATGASLYFTVAAAEGDDPLATWHRAKVAASEAIVHAGATITHHHAVGTDHRPYLAAEVGELGVRLLQALVRELDPQGVMNPGVLVPPDAVTTATTGAPDGAAARPPAPVPRAATR
jgi:alkyldihydroxyacetonephosphate synthase